MDAARRERRDEPGVKRLGAGLVAEAHAPDGLVESVRVATAKAFACGVRHPEWHPRTVDAFAAACREHRATRFASAA